MTSLYHLELQGSTQSSTAELDLDPQGKELHLEVLTQSKEETESPWAGI